MFEFGILKIQRRLDRDKLTKDYGIGYSWDENKFIISKFIFNESSCAEILPCISDVREMLLADSKYLCVTKKKSKEKCDILNITSEFSHAGFVTRNFYKGKDSSEAVRDLKNITNLKLTRFYEYKGKSLTIECEKELIDDDAKCSHEFF